MKIVVTAVCLLAPHAFAQPAAPWLKVDVLAPVATQVPMFPDEASYLQFGATGVFRWTTFSEYPTHGSTWWQPEGTQEALPLIAPVLWNPALGAAPRTVVLGVTEEGVAFGEAFNDEASLGTAWMQEGAYPFQAHALGLREPRHFGPNGEYSSWLNAWSSPRFAVGGTRVYQPEHPGDPASDRWLWRKDSTDVRPIVVTEAGRSLSVPYPTVKGDWIHGYAVRRSSLGSQAWMINAETGEQRRLGFTGPDFTMDADDLGYPSPGIGAQNSLIYGVDGLGHALGVSRRYTPEDRRAEAWIYSWQTDSYTRVEASAMQIWADELSCAPDPERYIMQYSDGDPLLFTKIAYSPGLGLPLQQIEHAEPWDSRNGPQLISVRWEGNEPVVIFGYQRNWTSEVMWNMNRLYVWRPSTGAVLIVLPGIPSRPSYTRLKSPGGRYLLLAVQSPDARKALAYGLYDTQSDLITILPASPVTGAQAVSATFVGESVLLIFAASADGGNGALIANPDGSTVDVSAQLGCSLADRGVDQITALQRTQGGRVLLAATAQAGGAMRVYVTPVARCSVADIASVGAEEGPDHALNHNDFIRFIDWFFRTDPRADFAGQATRPGPDGRFDNNDVVFFIDAFFTGCP